jgi:hypothetical protein
MALDCKDSIAGLKTVHLIETANITAFTETAGVITGITKATGKRFWGWKPARDTASAKSTLNASAENGSTFWEQEVSMSVNKMQTNTKQEVQRLAQNNVYAVTTDQNGKHWLYGYKNGLDASGGESGSGTKPGDRNGYTITLKGAEPEDAIEIDATTFADLETPGP